MRLMSLMSMINSILHTTFGLTSRKILSVNPDKYSGLTDGAYKYCGCVVRLVDSDGEWIFTFMIYPSKE